MSLHHLAGMMARCRGGPLSGREQMVPVATGNPDMPVILRVQILPPPSTLGVEAAKTNVVGIYELDVDDDGLFWRWLGEDG